jgi:hypothetical protein
MINSAAARPTRTGFKITMLMYAGHHNQGTRNMPARTMVPRPDLGLGPIWGDAFLRVSKRVADEFARAA